jgi:hypothetical protein
MMTKRWITGEWALCLLFSLSAACGEPSAPDQLRFHFVVPIPTDSIWAPLAEPLVLEVRSGDEPVPNVLVRFRVVTQANPPDTSYLRSFFTSLAIDNAQGKEFTRRSDASGRVRLAGTRGSLSGVGMLIASDSLGTVADTLRYVVLPGQPVALNVDPPDTTMWIDADLPLRVTLVDQIGNYASGTVPLAADSIVTITGNVIHGSAFGRVAVTGRFGTLVDSAFITVAPPGFLARYQETLIVYSGTDGRDRKVLTSAQLSAPLSWSPDGQKLAFATDRLYVTTMDGSPTRVTSGSPNLYYECWPQFSRDGQWIYFGSGDAGYGCGGDIWRVHPDGGGLVRVNAARSAGAYHHPSPSPDGTRVALVITAGNDAPSFGLLEVASGSVNPLGVAGISPHWAPTGETIAYMTEDGLRYGIWTMRSDGTDRHRVGATNAFYPPGLDWSADGRWLVVSGAGLVELVEVTTGRILPLTSAPGQRASWRPMQ